MTELQITEMVLLTIGGWALITFVVRDMFLTARCCLTDKPPNQLLSYRKSSGFQLVGIIVRAVKSFYWHGILLERLNLIVPFIQFILWKGLLIIGFALLYLAINWQLQSESFSGNGWEDFSAALWLSLKVSFRLALYDLALSNPMIFLFVNIQFYSGFLFFGVVCFYLVTLRQKAKKLQPSLYKLRSETDQFYSPLSLADSLREYSPNNLLLILQDWEEWAENLRKGLHFHRHLIYGGIKSERGWSWLKALNVVLDASAALIVTSDEAVEKQARRAFAAARRTLVEAHELAVLKKNGGANSHQTQFDKFADGDGGDDVLSAEMLFDPDTDSGISDQSEMFAVWRFTYEKYLRELSGELEVEIPLRKYDGLPGAISRHK